METIFKVGDKVFDYSFGWGKVIDVTEEIWYPVEVMFEGEISKVMYTKEGKRSLEENEPVLSFTEYTLQGFSQERPINYGDYEGKWGKFWNKDNPTSLAIDVLYYTDEDEDEEGVLKFFPYIANKPYDYFKPLTEEQLKILNLE